MRFTCLLRCKTEPNRLRPILVTLERFKYKEDPLTGSVDMAQLGLRIYTDTDADGTPDAINAPISEYDFFPVFGADTAGELTAVQNRTRGVGSLSAMARNFAKNQIKAQNLALGGTGDDAEAQFIDLDSDTV